jgi:hypothetical protein
MTTEQSHRAFHQAWLPGTVLCLVSIHPLWTRCMKMHVDGWMEYGRLLGV